MKAQELRNFMVENKITTSEFSKISGVSRNTISKYLNEKVEVLNAVTEGKFLEAMRKIEK